MERITIPDAVKQMLTIVDQLCSAYPHKSFTLDGRLVGDLGEVLAEETYQLALFQGLAKHHDAETPDGKLVQIKCTMKESLTFPADHIPNYYLGLKLHLDGTFEEIFNGPGAIACQAIKNRGPSKTNLHSASIKTFAWLQKQVDVTDMVARRT